MNDPNKYIRELLPSPKIDLFRMHHHPYYIFTFGFRQESNGFRILYYLCHILNECGYEAYVIDEKPVKGLHTPILTHEIYMHHKDEGRHPIAVYNEAIQGNPLDGDIIVRWIMNKKGLIDGNKIVYPKSDLMYYWSIVYANEGADIELLNFPTFDRSIFNTDNVDESKRSGFCYYAHKYLKANNGQAKLPEEMTNKGVSLCQDIKRTHNEIANILQSCETLYCYELSALTVEAELCGCSVVFVKSDYLDEFNMEELEYPWPIVSEDDINYSNSPHDYREDFNDWYNETEANSWETIERFVSNTQSIAKRHMMMQRKESPFISFCHKHNSFLYIYGTGDVSWSCYQLMKILRLDIKGFVISDDYTENDNQKIHMGLPVYSISEVESQRNSCGLILAMVVSNQSDVIKNLREKNFNNYICF